MGKVLRKAIIAMACILATMTLMMTPGCKQKQAELEKVSLRITCWAGYAKPYEADFKALVKEKYKVDVELSIHNPTDQDEFFLAVQNDTADLISPPIELPKTPRFYSFDESRPYLQPVDINNIPNLKQMLPVFRNDTTPIYDGRRYGVPYNCGPYGLAYNTDQVKAAPESWNILWEPEYAGKYTINNNFPKVNVWITALALGYSYDDIFDIEKLDRAKIQKGLDLLAKNAKSLWDGAANPEEFPELTLATTWGFAAQQANLKGGNWLLAAPKEGGTAWIDCWYIGAGAKDLTKQLAEEWINFMLAEKQQADVVKSQGVSPVIMDAGAALNDKEKAMFHVGDNDYFKTVALWRVMTEETEQAFDAMWQKAKKNRQ